MKQKIAGLLILIAAISLGACSRQKQAYAKIYERIERDSGLLMIKYSFVFEGKTYLDSTVMTNQVIEGDSILVNFNSSTPQSAIPDLSKTKN